VSRPTPRPGKARASKRPVRAMFSLAPVDFRDSGIAGRGVFAKKRFEPGEVVVPYAPKQRRVDARDPEAVRAAETKLTLWSSGEVIIPDTSVPGGWLCNHSCNPNAALFSSGQGRIQCTRLIAPGEEVTIFYGWVTHNEPSRDPCRCGDAACRGFINFDLNDEDVAHATLVHTADGKQRVEMDDFLGRKLAEYGRYLGSIGQEQVLEAIASTLVRIKLRPSGSVVCGY
jgi:uncharacterized protein